MQQYNGFVYLWFDSDKRMFYIGSHSGSIDDGYLGSGIRFMRAYNKRPQSFRRKVIEYIIGNKYDVLKSEQRWLDCIKDTELNSKYYNQKKFATGGSVAGRKQPKSEEHIQKLRKPRKDTSNFHSPKSEEHKKKISQSLIGIDRSGELNGMFGKIQSTETKHLMSIRAKNRKKLTCQYCNKDMPPGAYSRYHGEKCRLKKIP